MTSPAEEYRSIQWEPETVSERAGNLVNAGRKAVYQQYGTGKPENEWLFHNLGHTDRVIRDMDRLITEWNKSYPADFIDLTERELLLIAASGHDWVQDQGPGKNEPASADKVAEANQTAQVRKRKHQYSDRQMAFIRACILATIVKFGPSGIEHSMTEPQAMHDRKEITPHQLELAELLADADFGHFGGDFQSWYEGSLRIYYENLRRKGEKIDPASITQETILKHLKAELPIIANHQWLSRAGKMLFAPKQQELIKIIQAFIGYIESGQVVTEFLDLHRRILIGSGE